MRLTIFGATGETGRELVRQGLAQGHQLTCLVRDPAAAKLPAAVAQVKGDARDADAVARAIAGSDAVLSALGSRSLRKNDLLDCASANILAGMKKKWSAPHCRAWRGGRGRGRAEIPEPGDSIRI